MSKQSERVGRPQSDNISSKGDMSKTSERRPRQRIREERKARADVLDPPRQSRTFPPFCHQPKAAKVEAWCLRIHADASLFLSSAQLEPCRRKKHTCDHSKILNLS
jgi:hypothetical protein